MKTMALLLEMRCPILARERGLSVLELALAAARSRRHAEPNWETSVFILLLGTMGAAHQGIELSFNEDDEDSESESSNSDSGSDEDAIHPGPNPSMGIIEASSNSSRISLWQSPWDGDYRDPLFQIFAPIESGAGEGISLRTFDEHRRSGMRLSEQELRAEALLRGIQSVLEESAANGQRPLHAAVINDSPVHIVRRLCELGPRALRARDVDGNLPIHFALSRKAAPNTVRMLLAYDPASVHLKEARGLTPMQLAIASKSPPGVMFELARADMAVLEARDSKGRSMLEFAAATDAAPWTVHELVELTHGHKDLGLGGQDMVIVTGADSHDKRSPPDARINGKYIVRDGCLGVRYGHSGGSRTVIGNTGNTWRLYEESDFSRWGAYVAMGDSQHPPCGPWRHEEDVSTDEAARRIQVQVHRGGMNLFSKHLTNTRASSEMVRCAVTGEGTEPRGPAVAVVQHWVEPRRPPDLGALARHGEKREAPSRSMSRSQQLLDANVTSALTHQQMRRRAVEVDAPDAEELEESSILGTLWGWMSFSS